MKRVTFASKISVNTPRDIIRDQVAINIRRGLPQARPYPVNGEKVVLVCGGPSLNQTKDELIQEWWNGGKVVAVNGSYQWCVNNGIKPSAMVMLDAREFNARFVETPVPGCKYMLASQCHPRAFDLCRGRNVLMWHALSGGPPEADMINEYYLGENNVHPILAGTTVAVRAICLLRMLGFVSFVIFGFDSCWLDGEHHAYQQAENDEPCYDVWLTVKDQPELNKQFVCSAWQMKQADDFQRLVHSQGNMFRLDVRGPGLIANMLHTGAQLTVKEKTVNAA